MLLCCSGKSSKWEQERQKRVTPLFLELREGSEIAGKAGTWRKAMVGVTRVYPEQEGHPQNTARLLHTYKHSLKMCKLVWQALQRAKERPKQVSHLLLRSQVAFHCECGALHFQGQFFSFPSRPHSHTCCRLVGRKACLILRNQVQHWHVPAWSRTLPKRRAAIGELLCF